MKTFLLAAVCLCLLAPRAPAQDAAPPNPVHRAIIVARQPPQDNGPSAFKEVQVVEAAAAYARLTHKKIVLDNSVAGVIQLDAGADLGDPRSAELIGRALHAEGFTLADASDDTVVVVGLGRNPRNSGLRIYTKPEELPSGELVCSYRCKLLHRDAREVATFLVQYIPPIQSAAFTPDAASGTLLLTEASGTIRRLLPLIEALDVAPFAAEASKPGVNPPAPPRPQPVPPQEQ